ncbi:hypothetical protein HK102_011479, partial [Quaeritorhiza haematococci]
MAVDEVRRDEEVARQLSAQEHHDQPTFTQEELEELFKRTSSFTVKSAMLNAHAAEEDVLDDVELLRLMDGGALDGREFEEEELSIMVVISVSFEGGWWGCMKTTHCGFVSMLKEMPPPMYKRSSDYQIVDDDFWDEEFGGSSRSSGRSRASGSSGGSGGGGGGGRKLDRESIINRYKLMQVQMQDRNGNFFIMKKRVSAPNPDLPTYVRLPPIPIPRSWVHTILSLQSAAKKAEEVPGSKYFECDDVIKFNLKQLGSRQFQAIYMDPPLLLPGEKHTPGKITLSQF